LCLSYFATVSSLGVHISFVRSIAMDSWTDKQLAIMKCGGNDKCNNYLKARGVDARAPIKQKYESDAAQLYKEVVKARSEGLPEPTVLTKKPPRSNNYTPNPPSSSGGYSTGSANSMGSMSTNGGGSGAVGGSNDPNGMERMAGESDSQYIARQTRLREEARARMQAKFGSGGGKMGGVGSGGSGMQGMGSDPSYNAGGGGGLGMDGLMSAFGTGLSMVGSAASTVTSGVSTLVQDDGGALKSITGTVTSVGGSFWSGFSNTVSSVASSIAQPDAYDDDGLMQLQREIAANRPTNSKYGGIGSETAASTFAPSPSSGNRFASQPAAVPSSSSSMFGGGSDAGEAPGLPGEDRNGVGRLTGETDDQYITRQTRLRDEAKARMAAKFGGGGAMMGGVGSSSAPPPAASAFRQTPPPSGNHGGSGMSLKPQPAGMSLKTVPQPPAPQASHSRTSSGTRTPPRKNSKDIVSNDDFFSSFGA
jgi:ADP-ribosylation factor GTPase-activating protein 1